MIFRIENLDKNVKKQINENVIEWRLSIKYMKIYVMYFHIEKDRKMSRIDTIRTAAVQYIHKLLREFDKQDKLLF